MTKNILKSKLSWLSAALAVALVLPATITRVRADETVGEKMEKAGRDAKRNVKQKGRKKTPKNAVKNASEDVSDKAKDVKAKVD